nr:hypothetical protein [Bacteroidota bacterium]
MSAKILFSAFLFFMILTFLSINIPFFWDGTFFSALSVHFYHNGFNGFIAPQANDTGGFPLFSTYLALMWKCFGKTLLVSHVAMLPFLFGITYEYFKLAKRFVSTRTILFTILLLMIEPVLITQSVLMGYDILITYFFLMALNVMYDNKNIIYCIAVVLLCMISVRGIMLSGALLIIDITIRQRLNFTIIKVYIPAVLFLTCWIFYHHAQTDWYIFSPVRENNAEQFAGVTMMFRQLFYIVWKNLDLGRIALWIIFIFAAIYHVRKKTFPLMKDLILLLIVPLVVLSACMILIKNPIGHKYFLTTFLILNIAAGYVIDRFEDKKIRNILFTLSAASLIAGNFVMYSQRYGNSWDSSLKIIPYFDLSKKMHEHIKSSNISPSEVATQFPLTSDSQFSYLTDSSYH